jgi:hypothetical protein
MKTTATHASPYSCDDRSRSRDSRFSNSESSGTSDVSKLNFAAAQASSSVTLNGSAATATRWSASAIVLLVPEGATTGKVSVIVPGAKSNGETFTVVPSPSSASLSMAFLDVTGLTPTTDHRGMLHKPNFRRRVRRSKPFTGDLAYPTTLGGSVCSRRERESDRVAIERMRPGFTG